MQSLSELQLAIERAVGLPPIIQLKLFYSIAILILIALLQFISLAIIQHRVQDHKAVHGRMVRMRYASGIFTIAALAVIWFSLFKDLATFLGIISAGLLIALQDSVANLAGFIFIIWRKPFMLGDRIQLGELIGDVCDIRLFQFSLVEVGNWVGADQSTGRIIHIPNSKVQREPLMNYTTGFDFIWHEIPVLITFESHWQEAKSILQRLADEHQATLQLQAEQQLRRTATRFLIIPGKLTPIVYIKVAESGVLLTLRYLTPARQRRDTESRIWEQILSEFGAQPDIDLAYPSVRYFSNPLEGKPGAGGPTAAKS